MTITRGHVQSVERTVSQLLKKLGIEAEITSEISQGEEESLLVRIKPEEASLLIGQHGNHLQALQHIARLLVRRETEEVINFTVDINDYRKNREVTIRRLARQTADQAQESGKVVVMEPMSPYERRLVHLALASNSGVETESLGEGLSRRVAIRPTSGSISE